MKRKFKAVPGKGVTASKDAVYSNEMNPDLIVQTIDEAYEQDGDLYDSIDEYSLDYYELPASKIKNLYGLYDGSNEDTGVETKDGRYYIAYSGHGVVEVTKEEMFKHFDSDFDSDVYSSITSSKFVQVDLTTDSPERYSGNGGRSWVAGDSKNIDTWDSREDAIEDGKSSFEDSYKLGVDWDVIPLEDASHSLIAPGEEELDDTSESWIGLRKLIESCGGNYQIASQSGKWNTTVEDIQYLIDMSKE